MDLSEIAAELRVDHILEGSVRRSGNTVRVTAQLIDVDTDTHLWSDSYDRELTDIFAIGLRLVSHSSSKPWRTSVGRSTVSDCAAGNTASA